MRTMFIGDSLAGGYFASSYDRGFVPIVKSELEQRGPVEHATAATAGGAVRAGSVTGMPTGVDLAVLELGTNDSLRTSPPAFGRQYDRLLAQIREGSPDAQIICVGLWRAPWRAWPYDALIRRAAERHGGDFVPLSDLYRDAATRGSAGRVVEAGTSDDFHPNDHGHRLIAERLLAALRVAR